MTSLLINHAHINKTRLYVHAYRPRTIASQEIAIGIMTSIMTNFILLFLCLSLLLGTCPAQLNCTEDSECAVTIADGIGVCLNSTGECGCNQSLPTSCFTVNTSSGLCQLRNCFFYVGGEQVCREGEFSRTTALLLSIFLINFGAANFYIRQFALAIPQIIIGFMVCVFQFGSCGAACSKDERTSRTCIGCCVGNTLISIVIFVWWLVDLVFFATNSRLDGNGCPLYV